jgi:hypothetical protein
VHGEYMLETSALQPCAVRIPDKIVFKKKD